MDNQHRKIETYRELSQAEIDLMNEVKQLEGQCGDLFAKLQQHAEIDPRWLNIGRTDLQKGFMALVRAVAKPESRL